MEFPILKMRDERFYDAPNTIGSLARISKPTARKLFKAGYELIITPCKMMPLPDAPDSLACRIQSTNDTFEQYVNAFTYANCSHEVGYYPAFYRRFQSYHERSNGQFIALT